MCVFKRYWHSIHRFIKCFLCLPCKPKRSRKHKTSCYVYTHPLHYISITKIQEGSWTAATWLTKTGERGAECVCGRVHLCISFCKSQYENYLNSTLAWRFKKKTNKQPRIPNISILNSTPVFLPLPAICLKKTKTICSYHHNVKNVFKVVGWYPETVYKHSRQFPASCRWSWQSLCRTDRAKNSFVSVKLTLGFQGTGCCFSRGWRVRVQHMGGKNIPGKAQTNRALRTRYVSSLLLLWLLAPSAPVFAVCLLEHVFAGNFGLQFGADKERSPHLPMKRVGLFWRRDKPMLQHDWN